MSAPTLPPPAPTRGDGWASLADRPLGRSQGWRPALRLAVRDLRRHPGRTAAAAVMIVVPVLLAGIGSVLLPSLLVSPEERVLASFGAADAALFAAGALPYEDTGPSPTQAQVDRVVGDDAVRLGRTRPLQVEAADGTTVPVSGLVVPLADPLTDGVVDVVDGRLPAAPDEVAVSPGLAATAGLTVGGPVLVDDESLTVVGVTVERFGAPTDPQVVALPGALAAEPALRTSWWLLRAGTGAGGALPPSGLVLLTRADVAAWDPVAVVTGVAADSLLLFSLLAAVVVLQVALLAGPAFAVAARKQERVLAVLAVVGADGRALRQVVLAQAVLVGVLGAVLGAAAGVGLGLGVLEVLRDRLSVRVGPTDVEVVALLASVGVGVVASVAAALVPALTAARRAGSARTGSALLSRRLPVVRPLVGVGLVSLGAVAVLRADGTQTVGLVAAVLVAGIGMVLLCTLAVALVGRTAGRAPTALRLAAREANRAGTRTVAASGAVAGAVAALVGTLCVSGAYSAAEASRYEPGARTGVATVRGVVDAALLADVRAAVPGVPVGVRGGLSSVGPGPFTYADLVVVTDACPEPFAPGYPDECVGSWRGRAAGGTVLVDVAAASLLPSGLAPEDLAHLRSGGVLVHEDTGLSGPTLTLSALVTSQEDTSLDGGTTTVVRAVTAPARTLRGYDAPALVVPETVARELGAWFPESVLVDLVPAFDTDDPAARAYALRSADGLRAAVAPSGAAVEVEAGYVDRQGLVQLLATAAAVLVVLVATFTATALALADGRRDATVLTVLGASSGLRRRTAAATSVIIAAVGGFVGAVAGGALGLAAAYRLVDQAFVEVAPDVVRGLTLGEVVPWTWIGLLLVGLPLVAGLVVAAVPRRSRAGSTSPVRGGDAA